ncbi:MAG: serine/threonine protein kinase [Deltaproteobacteria bacterium]|nr:serine/threonine protein kinase [Deltaproteobacteria bacterium]
MTPGEESLWDGRYAVVRTLGEGGMGRVVMVHDRLQGDRLVALKRLLPAFADETDGFLREFQILRLLAHPHIPRAFELGHALDGGVACPYFTMEISDGVPLLDLVVRTGRALSLRAVFQIAAGLLRALDHVHRRGFVHGDLKPANVLVAERLEGLHPHLIDFGVALPIGTATPDEVLATPEYAAPEQLFGEAVDARTDLYALGLLLYELIEHRRPWPETDPSALALARSEGPAPMLTATGCPPTVAALVRRLCAADAAERPTSAVEVLAALGEATGWDAELETPDAFVQHLLTVPLPWRRQVKEVAGAVLADEAGPWVTVVDVPPGYFARRLLGPVLDVAALSGARVLPLRFDERFGEEPPDLESLLPAREDTRPTVIVIENIDHGDEATLSRIVEARRADTRVVATRRDAGRSLHAAIAAGARHVALEPWGDEAMRAWLVEALGPITLPLASLPPTPAALVEALGALARERRIVRTTVGYTYVERPASDGGGALPTSGPEVIEALLACVGAPIPEAALPIYLGDHAREVPDLLTRGALRARGDGTVEVVAAGAERAEAALPPARRAGLHRRLAQALEEAGAPPRRIAEAWLESDAPLLAVPHLLAAAELMPGRSWLDQALALVGRARRILTTATREAEAPDLELWRYAALVLRGEAKIRLASGESVDALVEELARIGADMGHRHTLERALELRIEVARRRGDWDRVVEDTVALVVLEANGQVQLAPSGQARPGGRTTPVHGTEPLEPDARARIHLARGQRFVAQGLPTAALAELDAGLAAAERASVERRLQLLAARAELCLEVQWTELVDAAIEGYLDVALRAGRPEHRARARLFQAARWRAAGLLDRALAAIRETAEGLPRQRAPRLDAEIELELGWCHLELGDFAAAREHGGYAAALADEDGDPTVATHAHALEATAAAYLGQRAHAWAIAQRADRALVLELALAERGYAGADAVLREASQAGYAYQRRLERARAARAFRTAAEAALVRREVGMARDLAERSVACLRAEGGLHIHLPRHLATAARALEAAGEGGRAEEMMARARSEIMAIAARIEDLEHRASWLAHPEQQRILETAPREVGRLGRRARKRVKTGSRRLR